MAAKDRIKVYYDLVHSVLRDSLGNELQVAQFPKIFYGQQTVINLQLVEDGGSTAYTQLEADNVFEAAVDLEFNSALMMCQTVDAGINQDGDWGVDGNADVTAGQVSIRINAYTGGFKTRMGSRKELPGTRLELLVKDTDGNVVKVIQFPFRTLGLLRPLTEPADTGMVGNFQWFADPATGAQCLRIINDEGEVLSVLTPPGV